MWSEATRPVRLAGASVGGLAIAAACPRPAPLLAVVLLALAVAGRRGVVIALALGLVAAWGRPAPRPPAPGRPVTVTGVLERPWRATDDGWLASLRTRHYRQGATVELWRARVSLFVPGAEPPEGGRRLRARGLMRRAPGLANVPHLPTGPWSLRLKSRRFLEWTSGGPDLWWRLGTASRRRIERALERCGERPGTSLARALTLGDSTRLPPRWRRGLRGAGLAHLVALSGLHVGLLVGGCVIAGAGMRRGRGPVLGVLAAAGFLLIAGARPALLRATAMGVLAAGGLALGRRPHGLSLLAALAAGLALGEPRLLDDLGYRLTCSATAGILWLSPRLVVAWSALPGWLGRPLAVTVGAQAASLPWSLPAFRMVSPVSPGWNLLAVPWTALALVASLAWVAVALVSSAAAARLAPGLDLVAWPFGAVASLPPALTRPLPLVLTTPAATLLAVALALVLLWPRRLLPWAAVSLLVWRLLAPAPAELELRLLDVGQGEAVLLRDRGTAVLVDGGGWRRGDIGGRVLLPALAAAGVRRLESVVLTHPDQDHCGGLLELASYLRVDEVWTAPGWRRSACAGELLALPGADVRLLWAGETAELGRWRFHALHPGPGGTGRGNDRSLVLAVSAPGLRVLLTGDIGARAERKLLRRWPQEALHAEVLKVPHHGSATSTTPGLLAAVRPRLALVSCGRGNRYGHPSPKVVRRLEGAVVRLLRTDRSGAIALRLSGGRWRIDTPGAPHPD